MDPKLIVIKGLHCKGATILCNFFHTFLHHLSICEDEVYIINL